MPKGFIPDRGHRAAHRDDRGGAGHVVRRDGASTSSEVAAIVAKDTNVAASMTSVGRQRRRAAEPGPAHRSTSSRRRPRAQRRRDRRASCAEAVAACRASRCSCRIRRRFRSAAARRRACISSRCRAPTSTTLYPAAQQARRRARSKSPLLQDVTSDLQIDNPQVERRHRPRARGVARRHGEQIENALYDAYGSRQVSTIYTPTNEYWVVMELLPQYQQDCRALEHAVRALDARHARAAQRRRDVRADGGTADGQPLGPAAVGDDLVQPRAGRRRSATATAEVQRLATGRCRRRSRRASRARRRRSRRRRQGCSLLLVLADLRDLHRARRSVRELHPPDHDSLRPAVRRVRRAAHAAASSSIELERLRVRRHHHADRHREEERDHDDRLRARGASASERQPPAEAIVEAASVRFRPIMMTTMAALMGTLPIALGVGRRRARRAGRSASRWSADWRSRSSSRCT